MNVKPPNYFQSNETELEQKKTKPQRQLGNKQGAYI